MASRKKDTQRGDDGKWQPGSSGNPHGRPPGTYGRDRLGRSFIEAVRADFEKEGITAVQKCREEDPVAYCRMIAGMLPKESHIDVTQRSLIDVLTSLGHGDAPGAGDDQEMEGESEPVRH